MKVLKPENVWCGVVCICVCVHMCVHTCVFGQVSLRKDGRPEDSQAGSESGRTLLEI